MHDQLIVNLLVPGSAGMYAAHWLRTGNFCQRAGPVLCPQRPVQAPAGHNIVFMRIDNKVSTLETARAGFQKGLTLTHPDVRVNQIQGEIDTFIGFITGRYAWINFQHENRLGLHNQIDAEYPDQNKVICYKSYVIYY